MSYGLRDALECLLEFFETGLSDEYGETQTLKDALAVYRSERSLTEAELPDVAQFTLDPFSAQSTPLLYVLPDSGGGELTDNQQDFAHNLTVGVEVLDADVGGDWQAAMLATAMLRDVVFRMLVRRSPGRGPSLNAGGTNAPGAVTKAYATGYTLSELMDGEDRAHFFLEIPITVELDEER